jgi:FkbM family methyltransferase
VAVPFCSLYWKFPDVFLPYFSLDLPHKIFESAGDIRQACRIWADDASRREFLAQLRWRTHLDIDGLPRPVSHEQYFPDDLFDLTPDEAFIDCGAFDGDTIRALVRRRGASFQPIESFEPDPENYRKLSRSISLLPPHIRAKVRLHPYAVGERIETLRFNAEGTGASSVGNGSLDVKCVDLDHYLAGRAPTFIKMDIEGFEPQALAGATRTIRRHVPILAICCYHRQDHLWRLPLLMRSLSEDYRLFLRPHDFAAFDLVCYAVPRKRLAARTVPVESAVPSQKAA